MTPPPAPEHRLELDAINEKLNAICQALGTNQEILAAILRAGQNLADLLLYQQTIELQTSHPNPLNRYGRKCFSQTDEDGITLEILRRLGIANQGGFAEFGVGNGLENNSLILASLGWRGFWVGGEDLAFKLEASDRLMYIRDWITLENIIKLTRQGTAFLQQSGVDVASLDLDGNDIYFVARLLENAFRPKLFIVEYNAKFPPPVRFQVRYDPDLRWTGDDYFGASLSSFVELFSKHGYRLVCCNSHTGANAFFIRSDYSDLFADVPTDISEIYVAPRYHLYSSFGHRPSASVIERILASPRSSGT
jgi:hypothetical protein